MTVPMMRSDWWWPWWVSSLIDLGLASIAIAVLVATSHRRVRLIAGMFVVAGVVAAVLAPIVMTDGSSAPEMDRTKPTMRP